MDQLTTLVRQYEEKHKVSYAEKAKHDVKPVVETIRDRIGRKDSRFSVDTIDYTGSIYQKVKIDQPDEFDFDFPLSELEIEERAETVTSSSTGKQCSTAHLFEESILLKKVFLRLS